MRAARPAASDFLLVARVIEGVDDVDRQADIYEVLLATLQHRHQRRRVEFS